MSVVLDAASLLDLSGSGARPSILMGRSDLSGLAVGNPRWTVLLLVGDAVVELRVGALPITDSEIIVVCSVILIESFALSNCIAPSFDSDREGRSKGARS